jgi:hypothetical protein
VISNLHGVNLKTWYYQPGQVMRWSKEKFKLISVRPVGVTLPPSYLETFFASKKRWLLRLNKFEKRFSHNSLFSGMSDHFVVDLQLK